MARNLGRLGAAVALFLAAACSGAGDAAPPAQTAGALPAGHPPVGAQAGAAATQGPGGVVLETVDGGGYTYARLGAKDQEIWVAGPVTALTVGDTVVLTNPMAMGTFTSKALDRTFDNLYFADAFLTPSQAAAAAPAGGTAAPGGAAPTASRGVVAETMNSGGYTYVRVSLDGKDVWLAGPETTVQEGNAVAWSGGMVMRNFTSNTLKRTFDEILFVNSLSVVDGG